LVSKTPSTLSLLEVGEQAQKCTDSNHRNVVKIFLLKGIAIANDCDLKYKLSQNQRLLVELCLMQLASITFDGEKKVESFIIPLPILEKRLLYSRSNKTIDVNPYLYNQL
jgi:DNA polymerase-3 subunit gamma/tau